MRRAAGEGICQDCDHACVVSEVVVLEEAGEFVSIVGVPSCGAEAELKICFGIGEEGLFLELELLFLLAGCAPRYFVCGGYYVAFPCSIGEDGRI